MNDDPPRWTKWVPVAVLMVSLLSFMFALTVLYPWHIEHSADFLNLSRKITSLK
jgi:CHASE1-domain containing sensor protein